MRAGHRGVDGASRDRLATTLTDGKVGSAAGKPRSSTANPGYLGRFYVLDKLGEGGMGVIYSAYDPNLDRRVALKLLRLQGNAGKTETARSRLLREAQALARLSHPNIVLVHEVGLLGEEVVVVMEFISGKTLRRWVKSAQRSWQEILAVYRQAGQGLAAAHEVGVVHRDFKPDNAVIGDDGRVRVIDFGLARYLGDDVEESGSRKPMVSPAASVLPDFVDLDGATLPPESTPAEQPAAIAASGGAMLAASDMPLTMPESVLGTPAYMSPEQFASSHVGPATDQFSFCVSLYEALYGVRPFAGSKAAAVHANIVGGKLREPPKGTAVPGWVFAVLRRGLAVDPADRYPSMRALVDALSRDTRRTRIRVAMAALSVLTVASIGVAVLRPAGAPPCRGAADELAETWNAERREDVRDALFATGRAYAEKEVWPRVRAKLDDYAAAWIAMHRDACLSHLRKEQSSALLDRRMACLKRRRDALDSAAAVLSETTSESLALAVNVAEELAPVSACGDLASLIQGGQQGQQGQESQPAVSREVAALEQQLSYVEALEHSGRYADALERIDGIAASAEKLGYRPIIAEVHLVWGRLLVHYNYRAEAVPHLEQAAFVALATGMDKLAIEAIARQIYARETGGRVEGEARSLILVPYAESLIGRIADPSFVHALLLNNTGVVHLARGDRVEAQQYFARALAVKKRGRDVERVELVNIFTNLALVTSDATQRRNLIQQAIAELENTLGPSHPIVLAHQRTLSHLTEAPARARDILQGLCARYDESHPDDGSARSGCWAEVGWLYAEMGDARQAAADLARAVELLAGNEDPWYVAQRQLYRGYEEYYEGRFDEAAGSLREAAARFDAISDKWWVQRSAAEARLGIGLSLIARGRSAEALPSIEAALATFSTLTELNQQAEHERKLAASRVALAEGLIMSRDKAAPCEPRTTSLLAEAETWYRRAGQGYETRLTQIARLQERLSAACGPADGR